MKANHQIRLFYLNTIQSMAFFFLKIISSIDLLRSISLILL